MQPEQVDSVGFRWRYRLLMVESLKALRIFVCCGVQYRWATPKVSYLNTFQAPR